MQRPEIVARVSRIVLDLQEDEDRFAALAREFKDPVDYDQAELFLYSMTFVEDEFGRGHVELVQNKYSAPAAI